MPRGIQSRDGPVVRSIGKANGNAHRVAGRAEHFDGDAAFIAQIAARIRRCVRAKHRVVADVKSVFGRAFDVAEGNDAALDDAAGRYIADILQAIGFFKGNAPAVLGVRDFVIRMAVDGIVRIAIPNHRIVDVVDENARSGDKRIVVICGKPHPVRRGELDLRDAVFHREAREPVFDQKIFCRADGHAHGLGANRTRCQMRRFPQCRFG